MTVSCPRCDEDIPLHVAAPELAPFLGEGKPGYSESYTARCPHCKISWVEPCARELAKELVAKSAAGSIDEMEQLDNEFRRKRLKTSVSAGKAGCLGLALAIPGGVAVVAIVV